jgi:hypothetical protein
MQMRAGTELLPNVGLSPSVPAHLSPNRFWRQKLSYVPQAGWVLRHRQVTSILVQALFARVTYLMRETMLLLLGTVCALVVSSSAR